MGCYESIGGQAVVGHLTSFLVSHETGEIALVDRKRNQRQLGWGRIAAQTLGLGDRDYRLRGMYIEYVNGLAPGDPWSPPAYDEYEDIEYYEELSLTGDQDFLRVPLSTNPAVRVGSLYTAYIDDDDNGNLLRIFAQTQGASGIHAKAFTTVAGSRVVGAALVATPLWGDRTQDIVFARTYLASDKQITLSASHAVGLLWEVEFHV